MFLRELRLRHILLIFALCGLIIFDYPSLGLASAQTEAPLEPVHDPITEAREQLKATPLDVPAHRRYQDKLLSEGRAEEVLEEYRQKMEAEPSHAVYHYLYARLLDDLKLREEGFLKSIELDENFFWGHYGLGQVMTKKEMYKDAIHYYQKAIEIDPQNKFAHNNLGSVYFRKQEYEKSIEELRKAVDLDEGYARAWFNLARSYLFQEQYKPSIESSTTYTQLKPEDPNGYALLGMAHHYRCVKKFSPDDLEPAIKAYQKAIDLGYYPETELYNSMGALYRNQNYFIDAVKAWRKALEIDPDDSEAQDNLYGGFIGIFDQLTQGIGHYCQELQYIHDIPLEEEPDSNQQLNEGFQILRDANNTGRFYKAGDRFQIILKHDEKNIWALNGLAICLIGQVNCDNAIVQLQKALLLDAQHAPSHLHLGNAYYKKFDYQTAKQHYQKAIEISPDIWQAYANLGIASIKGRQYQDAKRYLKKALEIAPQNACALENTRLLDDFTRYVLEDTLSETQMFLQDEMYAQAQENYQRLLNIDPTYIPVYLKLGELFRLQGNTQEAIKTYEKALAVDKDNQEILGLLEQIKKE